MNYLGYSKDQLSKTTKLLNQLLADYHVYYQNLRNFHWNVTGTHFFDLHIKFEELYNTAKLNIDAIAERILTLRFKPVSTLKEYLDMTQISESNSKDAVEMVNVTIENQKVLIDGLRKILKEAGELNDEGTVDMASGFLADLEKSSWMLDAWRS
ncbi:MAG TPA: DNA starvation/stationary phase protection protein [Saprospiraceae bacterium]|nr:DNA starvation/stationary phase protection protein [Saprospiraceae bacterium]